MANETTSTSQAALIHTEVIYERSIRQIQEKRIFSQLVHEVSADGATSGTHEFTVENALGVATGGTEAIAITANTEVGMASSITVTESEGVLQRAEFTERLLHKRIPGAASLGVLGAFQSEDVGLLDALLAPDVRRLTIRGARKIEADIRALAGTATNTVGSNSDTPVMTLDLMLKMLHKLFSLDHKRSVAANGVYVLNGDQDLQLAQDILTLGGGAGAAVLSNPQQAQAVMNVSDDMTPMRGYRRHILGLPVLGLQAEDALTIRAAEGEGDDDTQVATLLIRGDGSAPDELPGWAVYVERHGLAGRYQFDAAKRAMIYVQNAIYGQAVLSQDNLVNGLTAIPA
jgi:hypothetical protein